MHQYIQATLAEAQRERDARDKRISELAKRMVHMESDLEEALRRETLLKQVHVHAHVGMYVCMYYR
jgi:hypothetical protein